MRLKDTGLTAQELKDMVNKYMVRLTRDMILLQREQKACICTTKKEMHIWISTVGLPLTAAVTEMQKSLQQSRIS